MGGLSDAGKVLRNEKIKTTDEFLVKKKDPLELPPNFEELPLPNTKKDLDKSNKKIEEILNTSKVNVSKEKSTSVEEVYIRQYSRVKLNLNFYNSLLDQKKEKKSIKKSIKYFLN